MKKQENRDKTFYSAINFRMCMSMDMGTMCMCCCPACIIYNMLPPGDGIGAS